MSIQTQSSKSKQAKKGKKVKSKSKSKSKFNDDEKKEESSIVQPLTLSKLKKILESPPYRANKNVLKYDDFITEVRDNVLSVLSVDERRNVLNNHLNETKLNKWNEKKSKFMDISSCSFQHTPLSISFYNFTYAHTSIEASKIWFNFINLLLDFEGGGSAECDLDKCKLSDCKRHLTIIDQLYSYVNTSDESLYGISTQEFAIRGGFKLLLKVFNHAGINNPIPPIILSHHEYKQHEFLKHFKSALDFDFLYAIPPNEARFSWIKAMLYNGHPVMSKKEYIADLLKVFYPLKKENVY